MSERNFFLRGVRFGDPRLTRNWRLWWAYLCWCLQSLMSRVGFWEPLPLAVWRVRRGNRSGRWQFKPLLIPWRTVQHWLRSQTGGRSHRCEFTDPENGALYGGSEGGYMERYFEVFLRRIGRPDGTPTDG